MILRKIKKSNKPIFITLVFTVLTLASMSNVFASPNYWVRIQLTGYRYNISGNHEARIYFYPCGDHNSPMIRTLDFDILQYTVYENLPNEWYEISWLGPCTTFTAVVKDRNSGVALSTESPFAATDDSWQGGDLYKIPYTLSTINYDIRFLRDYYNGGGTPL